jgi:predicted MPP superfamily phosphohydrolase
MILFIVLIIIEILTFMVISQHFYEKSWIRYYFLAMTSFLMSIWLWISWFRIISFRGIYDEPSHVWNLMVFAGLICGVLIPRIIVILLHFTGVTIRRKTGKQRRMFTNAGLVTSALLIIVLLFSATTGRSNFKTERAEIKMKGLNADLNGLKIALISDLHLSSFYHHSELMERVVSSINSEDPDLILNTGDFVTFGWKEFGRFDTILTKSKAKYGKIAILGNHDFGTYHPYFTEADKENNVSIISNQVQAAGYTLLKDESMIMKIGNSKVAFAGVITKGSFPNIIYGDIKKALAGTDSADLKILLAHDPNQWRKEVTGKTDIDITVSGHTHGMQIGIYSKRFKWSPARFFYREWGGLYNEGEQYLYVNRGLGVLGIPFRIWMPPEITILTLRAE